MILLKYPVPSTKYCHYAVSVTYYGHYTIPFTGSAVNIITFLVSYIVSGKYYAVSGKYYAVTGKNYSVSLIRYPISGIHGDVLTGERICISMISQKFCRYPPLPKKNPT